jgi:putative phosphoesterase
MGYSRPEARDVRPRVVRSTTLAGIQRFGGIRPGARARRSGVRIALISDTHLPRFGRALPRALLDGLATARVDLILHAGDWTAPWVPALLEAIAPLEAVAGNNDGPELIERFGRRRIVAAEGARLGLVHGDLGSGRTTPERAVAAFGPAEVDAVLFGHSHIPLVERLADGRLLVNPGSPTDKRRQPRFSWALLVVSAGEVRAELRFFDDRRP